jgi:hypothetical protein
MRIASALLVVVLALSSSLGAQPAPADSVLHRNPKLATVLSAVIPGAGQFYTGHYVRGLTVVAATAGGAALVARSCGSNAANCTGNRELGWTLLSGAWLLGVYNAGDEARDFGRPPEHQANDARLAERLVASIGPVIRRDSMTKR